MKRVGMMSITEVSAALDMSEDQIRLAIDPLQAPHIGLTPEQVLGLELVPLQLLTIPLPAAIDVCLGIPYWRREDIASYLDRVKARRAAAGDMLDEPFLREIRREIRDEDGA